MKRKSTNLLVVVLGVFAVVSGQLVAEDISQTKVEEFLGGVPGNMMYLLPAGDLAKEVKAMNDDWVILDIRPPAHYENGHIKGSLHIPLTMLVEKMDEIPKGKKIAVVCAMDTNSAFAVAVLRMYGIDAWIVEGGVPGWVKMGMPLEK